MEEEIMSGGFYVKNRNIIGGGGGATGGGGGTKCGRWNPTTEQVKVLTDLFRAGLRTPSTDQIQKISSQLSFYGKIESKNVFYWFQNHKARERQKRRRVSCDVDDEIFKDVIIRRDHEKVSSAKIIHDRNDVTTEAEREIETLQLFPIHSFRQADHGEKLRLFKSSSEYDQEAATRFSTFGSYMMGKDFGHPPLDLRLSFV